MSLIIRPIHHDDYPDVAACNCAAMPGVDDTAESLREDDAMTSVLQRWVAEVDGRVVGSASWFQLPSRLHPQKFWMDGAVHPDYQRRGIGAALLAQILQALAPKDPISLRTFSREDYGPTLRFLRQHGFVEAKRTWESYLDLSSFNFDRYSGQPERVEAQGIRLMPLPALQHVPDWQERLRELYNAIQMDVPDIDPAAAVPMAQFQASYLGSSTFRADGQYIALDGERWIGLSTLWQGSGGHYLNTGLTGVLPGYRRRGIALALKLRSLLWAQQMGVTQIRTTNASTNQGMLAMNEQLGFERRPAWLHLVRHWRGEM